MTLQVRLFDSVYNGAATVSLQYDDATANDWITAVIVTVADPADQWLVTITDTVNGHTFTATRGAGIFAVPASQISLAAKVGAPSPISGDIPLGSRLTAQLRYPA